MMGIHSTGVRLQRKEALSMDEVIRMYIRSMKISSGLNVRLIYDAWYEVSGAAAWTSRLFFRDGRLYVTLTSSVARNQLSFQREGLTKMLNDHLVSDNLFTPDDPRAGLVREIILK